MALADKDVRPAGGEEVDHNRGRSDRKDLSSSSLPSRQLPGRLCANCDGQRDQEDGPSFGGGQAVCHAALGHSRPGEMLIDSKFRPDLPQEESNSLVNIIPHQEEYKEARKLAYPGTHILLIGFSLVIVMTLIFLQLHFFCFTIRNILLLD